MTNNVARIAEQVKALPKKDFDEFLSWLSDYELENAEDWDRELEKDSKPGACSSGERHLLLVLDRKA